jgi:hypothetical protein
MLSLTQQLKWVGISGGLIIAIILVLLVVGGVAVFSLRSRYAAISRDLNADSDASGVFRFAVLNRAVRELQTALGRLAGAGRSEGISVQGIAEHALQVELKGLLMGERLVKANTGLLITLGLVGTFYGLTRSIGELASLVSSDFSLQADVAEPLTRGLTEALSGMSIAFTTSLVGISAAIVMTLLNVFASVAERRTALMLQLELYLERRVSDWEAEHPQGDHEATLQASAQLERAVSALHHSVERFDGALARFSENTRDFQEINLHLKDNIQRMSLSFADLATNLKRDGQARSGRP